ncbi:FkbM family methyltransferase [Chitinophaga barathri]|nr:FkbM family methyltransferase [Chitinophaga barathri]
MASRSVFSIAAEGILKKFRKPSATGERLSFWTEKYLKHLPQGPLKSIPWRGGQLWFTKSWELMHSFDEIVTGEIYRFKADTDTPRILDCGANIGLSVLYFAQLYPQARITAFEPDEHNFGLLKRNMQSYDVQNVEILQKAIWIHNDSITFESTGGQGSKIGEGGSITVASARLADLLQEPADFLKIDIEGAEFSVIKDCAPVLRNVKHLFLEYHGAISQSHELTEMLEILHQNGFDYYIREAADNVKYPFIRSRSAGGFEQQLNIFAVRRGE